MRLPIITLGLLSVPFHLFLLFFLIGLKAYRKGKREVDLYHQQTEKRSDRVHMKTDSITSHWERFVYVKYTIMTRFNDRC